MSGRGRAPKPADQRTGHSKGTAKTGAIETAPVDERLVAAQPPADLGELASEVWTLCVADMAKLGHLREPDLVLLHGYCETAGRMFEAAALINAHGAIQKQPITAVDPETGVETLAGWKWTEPPYVRQHERALDKLRLLSRELGLNPASRITLNLMQAATASIALGIRDELEAELEAEDRAAQAAKSTKRAPARK